MGKFGWEVLDDGKATLKHHSHSVQGARPTNEDAHVTKVLRRGDGLELAIFGVFDGHGGNFASQYCAENFVEVLSRQNEFTGESVDLEQAFHSTVSEIDLAVCRESTRLRAYPGTTLTVGARLGSLLYCCNVGDSRAVLCRGGNPHILSVDHSTLHNEERKRVEAAGGWVDARGVNGRLGMTRAIGDLDLKGHKHLSFPSREFSADLVISTPEITVTEITKEDSFVIIACDGLWGRMNNHTAVVLARKHLLRSGPAGASAALVDAALKAGSRDNITVQIVVLSQEALQMPLTELQSPMRLKFVKRLQASNANKRNATVHGDMRAARALTSTPGELPSPNATVTTRDDIPLKQTGAAKKKSPLRRSFSNISLARRK